MKRRKVCINMCQEIQLEAVYTKGAFHAAREQRIITRANKHSCIEFAQRAIATDNGYLLTKIREMEPRGVVLATSLFLSIHTSPFHKSSHWNRFFFFCYRTNVTTNPTTS